MTANALWLTKKGGVLEIGPAPEPTLGPREILIEARAWAVNPVDRYLPMLGSLITPWLKYPAVPGSDVAGVVLAVGAEAGDFKTGDRVLGLAVGSDKDGRPAEGAFQEKVVLRAHMASKIPDALSFESAAVVPLGVSTAASALFQTDYLGLSHPTASRDGGRGAAQAGAREVLLVWGGSTSVGSNAIQLGTAAGYDVVTTASPRNFAFVKGLGAVAAFDYAGASTVADISALLRGRRLAGALAIGQDSTAACLEIAGALEGPRLVAAATQQGSIEALAARPLTPVRLLPFAARMLATNVSMGRLARRNRARTKFIWGSSLRNNEVGPMIFKTFLPEALADGRFRAAPEPQVVGRGLSALPAALDVLGRGVSARKIVVSA